MLDRRIAIPSTRRLPQREARRSLDPDDEMPPSVHCFDSILEHGEERLLEIVPVRADMEWVGRNVYREVNADENVLGAQPFESVADHVIEEDGRRRRQTGARVREQSAQDALDPRTLLVEGVARVRCVRRLAVLQLLAKDVQLSTERA